MWGRSQDLTHAKEALYRLSHILRPELFQLIFSDDDHKKLTVQKQALDKEGLTVSHSTFRKSASMMARVLVRTLHPGSGRTITAHPVGLPAEGECSHPCRPVCTDIARLISTHKDKDHDPESSYSVILPQKL